MKTRGRIYDRLTAEKFFTLLLLWVLLLLTAIVATTLGAADLTFRDTISAIVSKITHPLEPLRGVKEFIVWEFRLPRVLMAIVAGGGLAVSGITLQATLRNPLVSPYTIGVSSAAGFGAALAIVLGVGMVGGSKYLVITNAFIFSLLAAFLVSGISGLRGMTSESVILTGIVVMYMFAAMTSLLEYVAEPDALQQIVFWLMGSLNPTTWEELVPVTMMMFLLLPLLIRMTWDLNAVSAGDEIAASLGVEVGFVRTASLVLATLIVSTVVCFTGTIGFIGLVAPHMARMTVGGDHRFSLPCACLMGGLLLLGADTVARTIIAPTEIPVGIPTSLMGVPFFVYLLMKERRRYWG